MNLKEVLELFTLLWMPYQISAALGCRDHAGLFVAYYRKALIGHTFLSRLRTSRVQCMMLCSRQGRCLSFNHEDTSGTCQLNSERREESPQSLQQSVGFSYFDGLKPRPREIENIATASGKLGDNVADFAISVSSTGPCCDPLGMESGAILDNQITAKNVLNDDFAQYGPTFARFNSTSTWCGGADPTWIQVTFNQTVSFCGLLVQAYNVTRYVSAIRLTFDADANWDSDLEKRLFELGTWPIKDVVVQFPHVVHSTFIRMRVIFWSWEKCMRFEILGCI